VFMAGMAAWSRWPRPRWPVRRVHDRPAGPRTEHDGSGRRSASACGDPRPSSP
jgi:hypothetical protein